MSDIYGLRGCRGYFLRSDSIDVIPVKNGKLGHDQSRGLTKVQEQERLVYLSEMDHVLKITSWFCYATRCHDGIITPNYSRCAASSLRLLQEGMKVGATMAESKGTLLYQFIMSPRHVKLYGEISSSCAV